MNKDIKFTIGRGSRKESGKIEKGETSFKSNFMVVIVLLI